MQRADPIELRKSLTAVELLKQHGLDFVPIPVKNREHKLELQTLLRNTLDEIIEELEKEEEQ